MGGKLTLWNKCFSLVHVRHSYGHPIIATSFSQVNSSEFSPIMPDKFGEHLTRDQRPFTESLQILQIHSSMTVLLLFSSSLIFYRVQVRGQEWIWQKLHFVLSDTFLCLFWCLFWIVVLVEDPNTAHYKICNRGSQVLSFYLLVFDRIHDAMHLNKISRISGRKTGPQHYRSSSIFNRGHGVLFIPVVWWWVCRQKAFFMSYLTIDASAIWSPLQFSSCDPGESLATQTLLLTVH